MAIVEAPAQSTTEDDEDRPGYLSRWMKADPVRAVAAVLILIQVLWRANMTAKSYHTLDEFTFMSIASQSPLNAEYLLTTYNHHLLPGLKFVAWVFTAWNEMAYWPYAITLILLQALVSVAFFRLLRQTLPSTWGILLPLAIMLFSPLTLEANELWVVGLIMLAWQLAAIISLSALMKYSRTRRKRQLVAMTLAVLFAMAFSQKGLLIVPLLFLTATCLLVKGGPLRSMWLALKRFWPAWAALGTIAIAYAVFYVLQPRGAIPYPRNYDDITTFLRQQIGSTLASGLVGGPWEWLPAGGGNPPHAASPQLLTYAAWIVIACFIAATIWRRRIAGRAWLMLAGFSILNAAVFAVTRLGEMAPAFIVGQVSRYVGEIVVVAAFCAGVALTGLKSDPRPARPLPLPASMSGAAAALTAIVIAALSVGMIWSTDGFATLAAVKPSRGYVENAIADMQKAPKGTVVLDAGVPGDVISIWCCTEERSGTAKLFAPLKQKPVFAQEGDNLYMFANDGHLRKATVSGVGMRRPAAPCGEPDGGYVARNGNTVRLPLEVSPWTWGWAVRIGYLSTADTKATIWYGSSSHTIPIKKGLNQYIFFIEGGGQELLLSLADRSATLCTDDIQVGQIGPVSP